MTDPILNLCSPKARIPRRFTFTGPSKSPIICSHSPSRIYTPMVSSQSTKNSFKTPDSSAATSAGVTPKCHPPCHQKSESMSSNISISDIKNNFPEKIEYSSLNYVENKPYELSSEIARKDSLIIDLNLRLHEKNILIKKLKEKLSNANSYEIQKKLDAKVEECEKLRGQLNMNQKEYIYKLEKETKRLLKLVKEGDIKLGELKEEIEKLKDVNFKLQARQGNMIKIIAGYCKESKKMKTLKSGTISIEEMNDIEKQFSEIEEIHNKLIEENNDLKHQLDQLNLENEQNVKGNIRDISSDLFKIMLELTQLVRIANIMHTGQRVDLEFLLGVTQQVQEIQGEPLEQCKDLIIVIRKDLVELRNVIADTYAEHCGDNCTTQ
ncbi:unnamed protein product [Blepharisma stoltei]|uniref:Uncharacterized protein n=1 Tax=Blepharisma stoltei TaxID=1481888 RepID=A0AAU9JZ80_9CILI|nr:unnamed protein product [Blepharisma stoltei]